MKSAVASASAALVQRVDDKDERGLVPQRQLLQCLPEQSIDLYCNGLVAKVGLCRSTVRRWSASKAASWRDKSRTSVGTIRRTSVCSAEAAVLEQKKLPPRSAVLASISQNDLAIEVLPVPAIPVSQKMEGALVSLAH